MQSVSIKTYAQSHSYPVAMVRRAIKAGIITTNDDGTLDPQRADSQWYAHTDAIMRAAFYRGLKPDPLPSTTTTATS